MNELMLREMLSQPDVLESSLRTMRAAVRSLGRPTFPRIVLTGSGDSLYAAMAAEHAYQRLMPASVWALPSATAARYGEGRIDGLLVAISVSGEVRRTLEAAQSARNAGGTVVAITARIESSLAGMADHVLPLPQPLTRATPHTRDYTATLLALYVLLEHLGGSRSGELDELPAYVKRTLHRALQWAKRIATERARTSGPVWFLGAGPDRGTAAYGALKFWEAGGSAAWWDDLEEFGHGSQLAARPPESVVLLARGPSTTRAAEMLPGLHRMGLRPLVVGESLGGDDEFPISASTSHFADLPMAIPLQALAYAFATLRGIDVALPLGGSPLGDTYEDVHVEWMRQSVLRPTAQGDG